MTRSDCRRGVLRWLAVALLALSGGLPAAHAGIADAPGADLEVSLVTYGPGAIYWERFGHDAIELRDRVSGQAVTFNYGVFDFNQDDFLLNFARGHMRYSIDAQPAHADIGYYIASGRWVQRQRLAFTPAQAAALRDFLLWNLRPENRQYDYDYYTRNCSTRVRDALDQALGGVMHVQMQGPSQGLTYRGETARLMSAQPWLMLMLDLGLGGYADQPLTRWQAAFIPMHLMHDLRDVRVADLDGGTRPLVIGDVRVAQARLDAPPAQPPDLGLPLSGAGLTLGVLLALGGHYQRRHRVARTGFAILGTLWLLFAGIAGVLMAVLWAFTMHRSAWANENLLLFDPLALLLLPAVWRASTSRLARVLVTALATLAVLALLAKLLPTFDQRNLPWIGFALPPWLAMFYVLRLRTPAPPGNI